MKIAVRLGDDDGSFKAAAARLQALEAALDRETGLKIKTLPWLDVRPPEDATEILFQERNSPTAGSAGS